ncbi:hypothetical protein F5X96DRAFT_688046 [Biscogniauxia mediterranea]|nr:hypothetical protein F5X96DRAFT_688046 [Biscogniauxia mediterranea]
MASPLYLRGYWHQYTWELLSLVGGEVTLLLVRLVPQPDDMPILPGQDPDTHRALGIEMCQRLVAAALGPIFLIDTHNVFPNTEEAVARYERLDNRPCIHIAHLGQAMAFVYPGQVTTIDNNHPANQALNNRAPTPEDPAPQAPAPRVPAYQPPAIRAQAAAQAAQGTAIQGYSAQGSSSTQDLAVRDTGSQAVAIQAGASQASTAVQPAVASTSTSTTTVTQIKRRYEHPVYPKYHGNPLVLENWPKNIPAEQNTSIWIDSLPADVTHHDILSRIRGAGPVKQLHINEPTAENPTSAAAKLIFFTRRAAEAVVAAADAGRFAVGGVRPRVTYNRWRTPEDPPAGRSRVLVIRGPARIANRRFLEAFWRPHFWWDVDEVVELPLARAPIVGQGQGQGQGAAATAPRAVVHYSFGSWRCQAAAAKRELERAYPNEVVVYYGDDPCGPE